ncbi:MAG TPA: NAD(P)H-quinone oxidoreductase [Thermoanaerobaculia bacterium]|nr:NAD(P)H-quinone oxidoreductase [Thermoanaerobaculia bacterium]
MRAVILKDHGDESVMSLDDVERPRLGENDIRIAVIAAGVNRADLHQREGHYPAPPGASEILGLECAGVVTEVGREVFGWQYGDRAMALLAGGGYAEQVVVHAGSAMHVPDALSDEEAAAIPETFLTAFLNIFLLAVARRGETLLVHGGGSGVGTAATTLGKLAGMRVVVTAGSAAKCARCMQHGADEAIDYHRDDFTRRVRDVDVVLDHVGALYLAKDLQVMRTGGRVVIIGSMGGEKIAEIDVSSLLMKRQQIIGSMLRARSADEKARIVEAFIARFGEDLRNGRIRPVIDSVFPIDQVAEAHRRMTGDHFGKIVLRVSS